MLTNPLPLFWNWGCDAQGSLSFYHSAMDHSPSWYMQKLTISATKALACTKPRGVYPSKLPCLHPQCRENPQLCYLADGGTRCYYCNLTNSECSTAVGCIVRSISKDTGVTVEQAARFWDAEFQERSLKQVAVGPENLYQACESLRAIHTRLITIMEKSTSCTPELAPLHEDMQGIQSQFGTEVVSFTSRANRVAYVLAAQDQRIHTLSDTLLRLTSLISDARRNPYPKAEDLELLMDRIEKALDPSL